MLDVVVDAAAVGAALLKAAGVCEAVVGEALVCAAVVVEAVVGDAVVGAAADKEVVGDAAVVGAAIHTVLIRAPGERGHARHCRTESVAHICCTGAACRV